MNKTDKLVEQTMKLLEYSSNEIDSIPLPKPTNKTNFEGFDLRYAGNNETSIESELLPGNKYRDYQLQKGRYPNSMASGSEDKDEWWTYNDAYIAEITPQEYFDYCYKYIFKRPVPNISNRNDLLGISWSNVEEYAKDMKNGTKFYMPYINFRIEQQEGRHRALAAQLNGYKTIPCVIII